MQNPIDLDPNETDHITAALKLGLGLVPLPGMAIIAEFVGTVIPNQRIDRVASFASALQLKLAGMEEEALRTRLTYEKVVDLFESAVKDAANSSSPERRDYLVSIVAKGFTSDDVEISRSKMILGLLRELSDVEIIWLRFFLHPARDGDAEFRTRHHAVLDGSTLQDSLWKDYLVIYKEHLIKMGLLVQDSSQQISYHNAVYNPGPLALTFLGRHLLDKIGLADV